MKHWLCLHTPLNTFKWEVTFEHGIIHVNPDAEYDFISNLLIWILQLSMFVLFYLILLRPVFTRTYLVHCCDVIWKSGHMAKVMPRKTQQKSERGYRIQSRRLSFAPGSDRPSESCQWTPIQTADPALIADIFQITCDVVLHIVIMLQSAPATTLSYVCCSACCKENNNRGIRILKDRGLYPQKKKV